MKNDIGETSDGYHTFNELYEHRHMLFMALCTICHGVSWKSKKHNDGTEMEGWFIAGLINPENKQITYHLPIRLWDSFHVYEFSIAPKWDGHTSADVLERLKSYLKDRRC